LNGEMSQQFEPTAARLGAVHERVERSPGQPRVLGGEHLLEDCLHGQPVAEAEPVAARLLDQVELDRAR